MADCLTTAEIEGLLADTLSPVDKARAEGHLAACDKCRQEVERGRADNELFGKMKQAYEAETVSRPHDPSDSRPLPGPPTESIEGYEILSEVHRGGQGVVYKAVQKATKRTIALKVLLEGPYASPRQRHRFEREIDLVASLQHPNIVTVYDSGVTRDGRHFFAMEYIRGQPLDAYLSDKRLSIDETLRLFQKICAAVNHAHQHGVIHRDLKPGNIRVDASGEPHVLDFGLAKAGAGGLTPDGAPVTVTGEFMGTLAYASPEQTKGDPMLIDIRTDVYSLGVILYEMLTGKYPYQVVGQMADVLKNIAEAEPKKPSTIRRQINDEVETIVLKALAKERERRYQSAETLGRDIEHYLNGQPIDAKRDSGWYVLKKALHRYKAPATAAAGYLVIVTVALLACLALWRQATEQRDRAIAAEQQQSRERERAEAAHVAEAEQRTLAEAERDRAIEAEQKAQRQAFLANIRAAGAALSENEISAVRRHLDAVPPELRNWEWRYLNAQSDDSLAVLQGGEERMRSIDFSPDGARVAAGSDDGPVYIWDVSTGQELTVLRGHESNVYSVAFSPDGTRLASASGWGYPSHDNTIRLWDLSTGKQLAVLKGHKRVGSVAFSPDGKRLASASSDNTVRLWNTSTHEEMALLEGHEYEVKSVAFSPDGTRVASASMDQTVRLWDAATGEESAVLRGHESQVHSVAFSPDGSRLASGSWDRTARIWDVDTGEQLAVLRGHQNLVNSVAFSPDGTRLASASSDRTVRIWDTATGKGVAVLRGHKNNVRSVAFGPDGTRLASASGDMTIRLWDVCERLTVLGEPADTADTCPLSVAFSPDGTRVASGSGYGWSDTPADDAVRLWDPATGEELAILRGHQGAVWSVAFSPDGSRLASGSWDRTVRIWDVDTGEQLAVMTNHTGPAKSVAFSRDGAQLASASADKTVRLWDTSTGEQLAIMSTHTEYVTSVAFSPDGIPLASASGDKTVRIWDTSTGEQLAILKGHERGVRSVAFSPNGTRLASASWDKTVRLWDLNTGEELSVMRGHDGDVSSITFSPDGARLASASGDTTVRLWDASTGDELAVLRGHEMYVEDLAFSPDGTSLASTSWDLTVHIWHTEPYRVRYQRRQTILAARPEAERMVEDLWQQPTDPKAVADQLRQDASLSEAQRRAALNLLLSKSAQLQEHVRTLYARLVFTDDVVAALEADGSLVAGVRYKAVKAARAKGDKPGRLCGDSWLLVRYSGGEPQRYALGLRGAQAAVAAEPENVVFASTLGMAQYRNGQYEEAHASLSRCDELRRHRGAKSVPRDVAVLAMVLFRLDRIEEAQATFERLQSIMGDAEEEWMEDQEAIALFEECRQLLKGSSAQAKPPENAEEHDN